MVHEQVLTPIAAVDLAVHVIWAPIMPKDDFDAATASRSRLDDPRAQHYWDDDKSLAVNYAPMFKLPEGNDTLAWDIYFYFEPGSTWSDELPFPSAWWHQLSLGDGYLGDGSELRDALSFR